MPTKHFYLTDEIYMRVQQEENASSLVSSLLEEHYRKAIKPNLEEVNKELDQVQERAKILSEKKTEIMVEQKTQEFTEQQVREKEEKRAMTKVESIRKNMCFFFPEFSLLEIDEQDKLIVSYLDQNDLNVIQFLISKGFKDNVKEDDKPKSL